MTARCSIVIPVRDGAALTSRCLEALASHAPEVECSVLVVDDGSATPAPQELSSHAGSATFLVRGAGGGFAAACNEGAAATAGEFVVFLNNDTVPQRGWLDALVRDADANPAAAAIGCRLLFPDDTIQHAGVVMCRDGLPRHIYAGFPSEHPAVMTSRRFHAVTAACLLMRRAAFEQAGGFDSVFHNGLEDVDLCLRLEELGYEVRYCHESVVYHLESASRGRRAKSMAANTRHFQARWKGRIRPDELDFYAADGLLTVGYESTYPIRLAVAPELATIDGRGDEADRLLAAFARRHGDLLHEVARLSASFAPDLRERPTAAIAVDAAPVDDPARHAALDTILRRAEDIEIQIHGLQEAIVSLTPVAGAPAPTGASPALAYRKLVREARQAVQAATPEGATVLVVSSGDDELVSLDGRAGRHFPQDETGTYLGYHPADGESAVRHLEQLRADGAEYLLVPSTATWWLAHYGTFARHLETTCSVVSRGDAGVIFSLGGV